MNTHAIKRKLAALLAVVLMVPTYPVFADNLDLADPQKTAEVHTLSDAEEDVGAEQVHTPTNADEQTEDEEPFEEELENDIIQASDDGSDEEQEDEMLDEFLEEELLETASPSNAEPQEEVIFNTGNVDFHVVSYEDYFDHELGDAYFEEDGSYTIHIPEADPFFPYEVQFTCDGRTVGEWFMTPEDEVEISGHTFYVSAYFGEDAVTQMSLEVAGDTVVVYPEEKEFTNDGGMTTFSLLPLEEKNLTVDLTGYTPVELTQVTVNAIFAGSGDTLEDGDQIIWTYKNGDDEFVISSPEDTIDLSRNTCYSGGYSNWEMIVGDADQLAADNIRYQVQVQVTDSANWLKPTVYFEDESGTRTKAQVLEDEWHYQDYYAKRWLEMVVPSRYRNAGQKAYLSLEVNDEVFPSPRYDFLEVYFEWPSGVEHFQGEDITDQILGADLTIAGSGYEWTSDWNWDEVIFVSYDASGNETGRLPVNLRLWSIDHYLDENLLDADGEMVWSSQDWDEQDEVELLTYELLAQYPVNDTYYLQMDYIVKGQSNSQQVTAAYVGNFESIAEAQAAGAADITRELFGSKGYGADYSQGVYLSVFVGADGTDEQEVYRYLVKTEGTQVSLSGNTYVQFSGLKDKDGNTVPCQVVPADEDSYGQYNYLTILVDESVDISALAPTFYMMDGMRLYTAGSSTPEVSGRSVHDFSGGAVQYSVSAENGTDSKNYWLQVVPSSSGAGRLYINSLADEDADTAETGGVVYSTREIFLDGIHDYVHDIFLANMGTDALQSLSVELDSEQVQLDDYWTLHGTYELAGFTGTGADDTQNWARLRLVTSDAVMSGLTAGGEISGTLTIKAGNTPLVVLTLTGMVGDPGITTEEIPDAVKYVHYGTMIQNNNKYDFNTVSYRLTDGALPEGMTLRSNGELYGVPKEAGEFWFAVEMTNSYSGLDSSEAGFTLTVIENTDENVDNATDENYDLKERVPDITLSNTSDHTMASIGLFDQWENLYLDGEMLTEGVDYTAESGSTRLTIRSQTLKAGNTVGTHTLSAEFRTPDTKTLKRAAQNYRVTDSSSGGGSSSGGSSSGGSDSSGSSTSSDSMTRDAKKGYVNSQSGIITGAGAGYSHWEQDETGWRLIYADGTVAAGYMTQRADGTQEQQVCWEKVNGSWYAFGLDGYLAVGWVYDGQRGSWYYVSEESGMRSGWHQENQDGCTYYLDPASGALVSGWKQIAGKWYYLNDAVIAPTWEYDSERKQWFYNATSRNKPAGALYRNEKTPDGYQVDENGVWDGAQR